MAAFFSLMVIRQQTNILRAVQAKAMAGKVWEL